MGHLEGRSRNSYRSGQNKFIGHVWPIKFTDTRPGGREGVRWPHPGRLIHGLTGTERR